MKRTLQMATTSGILALLATASVASPPSDYNVSLCQQAVKAQITLEHDKTHVEFGDKKVATTNLGASQVEVTGKGHLTRHDGTKKPFNYTCAVDSAAGRVLSASFKKTD